MIPINEDLITQYHKTLTNSFNDLIEDNYDYVFKRRIRMILFWPLYFRVVDIKEKISL